MARAQPRLSSSRLVSRVLTKQQLRCTSCRESTAIQFFGIGSSIDGRCREATASDRPPRLRKAGDDASDARTLTMAANLASLSRGSSIPDRMKFSTHSAMNAMPPRLDPPLCGLKEPLSPAPRAASPVATPFSGERPW